MDEVMMRFAEAKIFIYNPTHIFPQDLTLKLVL